MNNRRVKLFFIINTMEAGGAERVLVYLLNKISSKDFDITLCLIENRGFYLNYIPHEIKKVILFSNRSNILAKVEHRIYRHFRIGIFERIRINLKVKEKYDVGVSFLEGEATKFHSYIFRKFRKNFSWVHSDLYNSRISSGYSLSEEHQRRIYKQFDKIFFVSNFAFKQFYRRFAINKNCIIQYNPVDVSEIIRLSENEKIEKVRFTVSVVGRLSPEKGIERVLRVAKRLFVEKVEIDFWIIGDGILYNPINDFIKKNQLASNVKLLGFKSSPYPYISSCDILICPSEIEGFSMVICEALALSKAVISTKCVGPIEILDNGKFGLLCDHDDSSIYNAILNLYNDSLLRNKFETLGRQRVESLFDAKVIVKNIEEHLKC